MSPTWPQELHLVVSIEPFFCDLPLRSYRNHPAKILRPYPGLKSSDWDLSGVETPGFMPAPLRG